MEIYPLDSAIQSLNNRGLLVTNLTSPCRQSLSFACSILGDPRKTLVSMRCMLFRYSLKPSPKRRVLVTVGSVMTIGLSINRCLHSKKTIWREKTTLTCSKVGAVVPFSPPRYYPSFSELRSSAFVKLNETEKVWKFESDFSSMPLPIIVVA